MNLRFTQSSHPLEKNAPSQSHPSAFLVSWLPYYFVFNGMTVDDEGINKEARRPGRGQEQGKVEGFHAEMGASQMTSFFMALAA